MNCYFIHKPPVRQAPMLEKLPGTAPSYRWKNPAIASWCAAIWRCFGAAAVVSFTREP
jgi:hypothetical protein